MDNLIIKDIEVKSVLTKSNLPVGDFSVNPYVGCTHACRYCYASFMKRFTGHTEPWGGFLDVKHWTPIANPKKYCGKEAFFGSVTDPYLPEEEVYRRTRSLLEQLKDADMKISIQTKSDLVLRDLDLLKQLKDVRVGFSINTLDEEFKNDMDRAVSIERRIAAMERLHSERIRTTCFISPIFPGITNVPAIIDRVKDKCNLVWLENLNLRGTFKGDIMDYIKEKYAHLVPLYDEIYNRGKRDYWERLNSELSDYAVRNGMLYVRDDDSMRMPFDAPPVIVNYFYHNEVKKSAKTGK